MPGFITTRFARDTGDAMRRAAEEAARRERERKRNALKAQIERLKGERSKAEEINLKLQEGRYSLERQLEAWAVQKNKCDGNLLLSEVVLVNRFEGVCADKVKEEFSSCVNEMNITYVKTERLRDDVDAQIQKLGQYIAYINSRISSLTRELNAI